MRVGCLHERDRIRRRSCSAPALRARSAPDGSATAASASRSSSRTWSAASAPTTPACPRRRCCARASCSTRRAGSRASREAVTGELDPRGGPRPPRRGDPRPRRLRPGAVARGARDRALPRRGHGSTASGGSSVGDDDPGRAAGGRRRDRLRRGDAADRRSRLGRGLEQPRRDDLEAGPAQHDRARRRAGRRRARPGLVDSGDQGRRWSRAASGSSRARSPSPASRSRTRCAGSTASTSAPAPARSGSARSPAASRSSSTDGERLEAEELLVAVGRRPRTDRDRPRLGRDRARRGRLPRDRRRGCGSAAASGSTRSATSTAGRCSPTRASTRPGSPPRTSSGASVEAIAEELGSPRVTFTDPQVAAVGKTLEQAQEAGIDAIAVDVDTDGTAGASFYGKDTGGTTRIVVDRDRGDDRRRHLHRLRDRRLPPRGDRRDRRRGAARRASATRSRPTRPAARSGSSCSRRYEEAGGRSDGRDARA